MKNEVDDIQTPEPETTEPQVKEKTPPKKIKKSSSIIKKFKLKTKSGSSPSVSSTESESRSESKPSTSNEGTVVPEEENLIAAAVSDSNLTETNWESAENLVPEEDEDTKTITTTTISIASTHVEKKMPAFGELILDASSLGSNQNNRPNRDHLYKILVIGDLGAGKTSIIKRYVHDFFSQHYRATIGVDFALKVLHWDANTVIRLQLWDIAGQERYGNMTRVYYKEAVGAFIVFDVTRANTFESVNNWKSDLDSKVQLPDGSSIPCVLLGNKCDQHKEGVVNNAAKMDEFCKDKGFAGWFETSAKENINIEEAANALISKILENDVVTNNDASKDKDQFTLTSKDQTQNGKKCYKC